MRDQDVGSYKHSEGDNRPSDSWTCPNGERGGAAMHGHQDGDESQSCENLKRSDHLATMEQIQ